MIGGDEARVWALIAESARRRSAVISAQDACAACARALAPGGVGVSLIAGGRLEPVHVAGELGRELLEAELTSGDGPCVDAVATGGPVLVADLADAASGRRWPMFTATARAATVRAVFAFPLVSGAARLGVLVLCRDRPGGLEPGEHTDALIFADVILALLFNDQAGLSGRPLPSEALALGPEIHQAAGMVSVQLDCGIEQALVRLRAHAFAHEVALTEVAREVVERRLRFTPDVSSQG
ncbi:GAF and ANTAR domain-containing protein [Actinomadura sp. NTSP31]|uniref:GAF and ANTAR domain-containing protein n=1 Tax=Actinomadura sp. NTSP31 TaxID=1735447 RepID=UPI0035C143B3